MSNCVCERFGVKERREADVGLHIETFLAAGDEDRRGGKNRADRDRGREGRTKGKIRRNETARLEH